MRNKPLYLHYSTLFFICQAFLVILVGFTGVNMSFSEGNMQLIEANAYAEEVSGQGYARQEVSGQGGQGTNGQESNAQGASGQEGGGQGDNGQDYVIAAEQKSTIVDHCDTIKDNLKSLQRTDSRARVYLGRYYETILTDFITPLNVRLVENNISNTRLIDNQTNFAARRNRFVNNYISYQQALEELVNVNCKNEPEKFYEKLVVAREKRQVVNKEVVRMRELAGEQVKLVEELKNGYK